MRTVRFLVLVAVAATAVAVAQGAMRLDDARAGFPPVFDTTPPYDVHGTAARPPDHGGWYTRDVTYTFEGKDDESGIDSCDTVTYGGPDGADRSVTGACRDKAGNETKDAEPISYASARHSVSGAGADRAPDHGDWYTGPVTFTFHGSDTTSGIASCDSATYSGPDGVSAHVTGACTDRAGNTASKTISFRYDAN